MSICASSGVGQKLRLNVVALIGDGVVGRMLVAIDEDASVEILATKIRAAMAKSRIEGCLLRLTNNQKSNLPADERIGDVMQDGEEVIAVLTRDPEDPVVRQQLMGGLGNSLSFTSAPVRQNPGGSPRPRMMQPPGGGYAVAFHDYPSGPVVASNPDGLPGPVEVFEEDVRGVPAMTADKQLDRGPRTLRQLTCDWDHAEAAGDISARFREVYDSPADPGRTYLTVSMRPRERPGAIVAPLPVHYSVARVDIIEFERLCGRKVDMTRERLNYFGRSLDALLSLLDRGASRDDYAPNMMPYKYRAEEEVSGLIEEADEGQFGQVEGFRPIIVIDTAGALGENLLIVKAALKRMLYSFMVAKSRFNIVAFNGQGRATAWEDRLVPPVAQKLREAEDFLDSLRPGGARGTDILEAMGWALEPSDADAVYLLSSGFPKRADVPYCLASIRSRNMRQLPIHVIGVDCDTKSELDLRRLAEENRGSFRQKKFNLRASVSMPVSELLAASGHVKQPSGRKNGDQRLTVGGQVDVLEIMIRDQEEQRTDWLEEQKCANRILLSSASQQPVPDAEQARYAAGRLVVNHLCRAAPPLLQAMLDQGSYPGSYQGARPSSVGPGRGAPGRRGLAQPAQRRPGQRPGSARRSADPGCMASGADGDSLRRPSIANPWDRPTGVVKVSQLAANATRSSQGVHLAGAPRLHGPARA
eukprot:CAMPEP_0115130620 /NCGR_PEP_ID=MMETSP0227-20121206/52589_1 /TAXON_ID=89957 /ORGANISM="Polarella glacialis, Strain CCMP 1383" /LENGTH=699 /DNA_ID=CAMNT_0002535903 /DNA_START=58 /DNA_END=2155 /DNA_ORIENTATION=-